jgi:hypothetical protein
MNTFQQELRKLIFDSDWDDDLVMQKLESLISQAVNRQEALCGICQYNLDNYPPGPGELNIDVYKKALELACAEIEGLHFVYGKQDRDYSQYWIDLAESEV